MGELWVDLAPLALGIVASPLAIMALVAVLLSQRGRVNGIMFLVGWVVAIAAILALSYFLLGLLKPSDSPATPAWLSVVRIVIGIGLIGAAIWEYRKGRAVIRQMAVARTPAEVVAAAPQLPGWLRAVESFTAPRSLLLGFGVFALNPVDLSCAVIGGIDVRAAQLTSADSLTVLVVFGAIGVLPIAVPVVVMIVLGERGSQWLKGVRGWIASHNGMINAALLLVIGTLQLQKGLSALVG